MIALNDLPTKRQTRKDLYINDFRNTDYCRAVNMCIDGSGKVFPLPTATEYDKKTTFNLSTAVKQGFFCKIGNENCCFIKKADNTVAVARVVWPVFSNVSSTIFSGRIQFAKMANDSGQEWAVISDGINSCCSNGYSSTSGVCPTFTAISVKGNMVFYTTKQAPKSLCVMPTNDFLAGDLQRIQTIDFPYEINDIYLKNDTVYVFCSNDIYSIAVDSDFSKSVIECMGFNAKSLKGSLKSIGSVAVFCTENRCLKFDGKSLKTLFTFTKNTVKDIGCVAVNEYYLLPFTDGYVACYNTLTDSVFYTYGVNDVPIESQEYSLYLYASSTKVYYVGSGLYGGEDRRFEYYYRGERGILKRVVCDCEDMAIQVTTPSGFLVVGNGVDGADFFTRLQGRAFNITVIPLTEKAKLSSLRVIMQRGEDYV